MTLSWRQMSDLPADPRQRWAAARVRAAHQAPYPRRWNLAGARTAVAW